MVGLYFYAYGNLLIDAVDLDNAELYGECKIGGSSHYDVWSEKYENMYKKPYDYFPRGRVVYKVKEDKFIVYADKCIAENGIKNIITTFGLANSNVDLDRTDAHYVCKKCNKYYLED